MTAALRSEPSATPSAVPLRRFLARMIWWALGPLLLLALLLAASHVAEVRRDLDAQAAQLATQTAQQLDRNLTARMQGLTLLSNARSLLSPEERERAYTLLKGFEVVFQSHVEVVDPELRPLMSTRVSLDAPLPPIPRPKGRSALALVLSTGQPAVGDVVENGSTGQPAVALCVPVRRDGRVASLLFTVMPADFFGAQLASFPQPDTWTMSLRDSTGTLLTRRGPPVADAQEGRRFSAALAAVPWTLEVHIPDAIYRRPLVQASGVLLLAVLLAAGAGVMGSSLAAARLRGGLQRLSANQSMGGQLATGILEVDAVGARLASTQLALGDSERSYRMLFDDHPHPMWVVDTESLRFLAVNEATVQRYGYSRDEFLTMTVEQIRPESEHERIRAVLRDAAGLRQRVTSVGVWTHRLRDGRLIEAEISTTSIEFEGRPARLVLAVDVSERNALAREREAAREASSAAVRLLSDVLARVGDGFLALDRKGFFTYANDRVAALLGVASSQQLLGTHRDAVLTSPAAAPFVEACERALDTQEAEICEASFGEPPRWFEIRIYPSADGLSAYFTDVTRRRAAQDALARSERDFRLLAEQMPAIVYRVRLDAEGTADYISPRITELGYEADEWMRTPGLLWQAMHPEDRPRVRQELADALRSGEELLQLEYRLLRADGSWRHAADHARVIRPEDGQEPFVLGVNVDVSAAHEARVALMRSEAQYRRLSEQVPAIIYRARLQGDEAALYVSPHVATLGYTVRQWTSREGPNWRSVLHPDDMARVLEQVQHAQVSGIETTLEYRLRDAWGQWRHFIDHGRVVDDDEPGESLRQGVMLEITELKRTELALREAQVDQRSLFEALADGVLVMDAGHSIVDANVAASELLGYPQDELLKLGLQDLLPANERARAPDVMAELLRAPGPHFIEWETRRSDGSTFPAEVSARRAGGGRYVEVLRDVTERRAAKQALLQYQQELSDLNRRLLHQERETSRHLAQTLHDHLGQSLAVSRLRLDALLVSSWDHMPLLLQQECERLGVTLDRAIADVRRVLGDLRPPVLEEQGLVAALDNEVRTRALGGGPPDLLLEVDEACQHVRWPSDPEYGAFMIAREAMANAQLHAQATLVRVIIGGDARHLCLEVVDDGRGISEDLQAGRPGHLGLVGMRERAQAMGAQLMIESPEEGGTRVLLQWREPEQ